MKFRPSKFFAVGLMSTLATTAFGYQFTLTPASDCYDTDVTVMNRKLGFGGLQIDVEDFEHEELSASLKATVAGHFDGDAHLQYPHNPNAWDGEWTSTALDEATFTLLKNSARIFGVGIGDNDGGSERLSVNGAPSIQLSSLPGHVVNGQGRAYFLTVRAEAGDPDLRTVAFSNGFTIAFDHLISSGSQPELNTNAKTDWRSALEHLESTAAALTEEIASLRRKLEQSENPEKAEAPRLQVSGAGNLVVNGSFEEIDRGARGHSDPTGLFGEMMFAPGSTRLIGWEISEGPLALRQNIPSPDGGNAIELGPRSEPGCISQKVRSEVGHRYRLQFHACTGRNFQYNDRVRVKTGSHEEIFQCPVGSAYKPFTREFKAVTTTTTISFHGVGETGFGPVIDGVSISDLGLVN